MAKEYKLTRQQQKLVEDHLHIVSQTIHSEIITNETIFGFEYDDIYQEGCILLCKAAVSYKSDKGAKFETFARSVIRNGLRTYCRLMCNKQKHFLTLPGSSESEDSIHSWNQIPAEDCWDELLSRIDTKIMLQRLKKQYHGCIRLGIDAIYWKSIGYTGTDIAAMYHVKPTMVGACITRAVRKLKYNRMFRSWIQELSYQANI